MKNVRKSKYWLYNKYFEDGVLWDNTILFESFGGSNFQGNPYYMFRYYFEDIEYQEWKFIIVHKNPCMLESWLKKRKLWDSRIRIVEIATEEYINALSHSKFLINNVGFGMNFIKKSGQVYLNTWHGTPLKTLGRDVKGDTFSCNNAQRNMLLADILLAPNEFTQRNYLYGHMIHDIHPGNMVLNGYPRNSIFLDDEACENVKKRYHLEQKKTIFYMPTWRGNACHVDDVNQISEIERLAKDLGEEYQVFVKFHPAMMNKDVKFQYCYPMPEDIEVYEFLNGMDILITDYSSVFFDFAIKNKPIILYQYDKESYFADRGIYKEVENQICFQTVYNFEDLKQAVVDEVGVDYSEFNDNFGKYGSIDSPKQLAKLVRQIPEKRGKSEPVDLYIIDFPVEEKTLLRWKKQLEKRKRNYRFLFLLGSNSWYFNKIKNWDQFDYFCTYYSNNLSFKEKIQYIIYSRMIIGSEKVQYFEKREQIRLWGYTNIGHIYTKSKKLPVALKYSSEAWPKDLR